MENQNLLSAAALLGVETDSLLDFSQDTLNSMEAIMMMYDVNAEDTASEAFVELERLWRKGTLEQVMQNVAAVIDFDYDYDTLCSLDEQTQSHLMYTYLYDKSDVQSMYEIARIGVMQQELAEVAEYLGASAEMLLALPKEKQETLHGLYLFHHDEINSAEVIERMKAVLV